MGRTSSSSRGRGRGVHATKEAEKKRKRETTATSEPQQGADVVASRWSRSLTSDGAVQKLKDEGSFPPHLAYKILLSMESSPAPHPDEHVLHLDFFG